MKNHAVAMTLTLAVAMGAVSCDATSFLSEPDKYAYAELERGVEQQDRLIEEKSDTIVALNERIQLLLDGASLNGASSETVESLNAAVLQLEGAQAQLAEVANERAIDIASLAELETKASENVGGVMGLLGTVYPPLGQLSNLWLLLGGLFFKRPTENAAKSVKKAGQAFVELAKRDWAGAAKTAISAGRSVMAVAGLAHTSKDPAQLLAVTQAMADKANLVIVTDPTTGHVAFANKPVIAPPPPTVPAAA